MVHLQIADGGVSLQIGRVAMNILNKQLIILHCKKTSTLQNVTHRVSDWNKFFR
jgi:hypothetical protein